MENASKALLIAGAILLVIAIAVSVVNKTRGTIDTAGNQLSSMEIQTHNNHFKIFERKRQTYKQVKEILREVMAYDSLTTNSNLSVQVKTYCYTDVSSTIIGNLCCQQSAYDIYYNYCHLFRSIEAGATTHTEEYLYDVF